MKPRVGMITVGQSPRDDIVPNMSQVLGANIEVIEKGALDGLSTEEIHSLAPKGGPRGASLHGIFRRSSHGDEGYCPEARAAGQCHRRQDSSGALGHIIEQGTFIGSST